MTSIYRCRLLISITGFLFLITLPLPAAERLLITVKNDSEGAPLTLGIPFPQGKLSCPDHVRVLDTDGKEIASQTNLVTTWQPIDYSVKWLWVFFFSTGNEKYFLEYGDDVEKASVTGDQIRIKNAQRAGQSSIVDTGPLRFFISKRGGGFIDKILFDTGSDGFDSRDTIAGTTVDRGSFLDLLDDAGIDTSKAIIHRTVRERGSGPLHAILRLEGDYAYSREDNRISPFIIRIHAYAGKSYLRVFHTLTYTGLPDKHTPLPGEHKNIALSASGQIVDDSESTDPGWTQPNDQIAATGLSLQYNFQGKLTYRTGYQEGSWHDPGKSRIYDTRLRQGKAVSVFQTGPKPDRIPPVPNSTAEERITGFKAVIKQDGRAKKTFERAEGWAALTDERWGVSIGIKNFLEEYPKEISFDLASQEAAAYLWSPNAAPMSFARHSTERDQGMISNFAEGVTKTSEVILYFHTSNTSDQKLRQTMNYILDPPVPHVSPGIYAGSGVYGQFVPRTDDHEAFERALDYKFDWQLFNQHWEPWYGMFDYGDQKNAYFREDWYRWQNNEPAIDFMYWLQFMRTGEPKYYRAAEAMSRHTMDVDNVHWPADPPYYGDTNEALDYWKYRSHKPVATPYLGIGRRHARQHWVALLSAHVWLQGWLASYYITGYHRGLDIARLTADSHTRRIWGAHGLSGRRLYLAIWNLVEAWDATKDPKYLEDLEDRIRILLELQNGPDQYDNLVIDRYGYSQVYVSHGLYKYYQLTKKEEIKQALIRHARAVRDNPPYNHDYESYLATIHSLVVGYEFTQEQSFLNEALHRANVLKTDKLAQSFEEMGNQKKIAEALENASHLPQKGEFATRSRRVANWGPTQGLRVFGWTHIYNVPWLLYWLREKEKD